MVEENVVIFKVGTEEAVQSLGDLKNNVKVLKEALDGLDIGTQEYQDTLMELRVNQNAVKDAMHATSSSLATVTQSATGAVESYNGLVHRMAALKEEFRSTTDEVRRGDLGKQIKQINDRLKDMDALQGNYQRNVGNYANSVIDAFSKMGGGAAQAINPIRNMTGALNVMSKTPVIAVLGVLAQVIMKVISALHSSEEATNAMNVALSGFRAIADVSTRALQLLGEGVAKVTGWIGKLAAAITGTTDAMKEREGIARNEVKLAEQQRQTIVANAEAERAVAELRAKAADKVNYSAKERLEFLKQAGDKEKEIAKRAYEDAKLQYEITKAKNALTKSSAEEKRAEAEAYAAMLKAETNYHNQIRTINAAITTSTKEMAQEVKGAGKEVVDFKKVVADALQSMLNDISVEDTTDKVMADLDKAEKAANDRANKIAAGRLSDMDKATKHQLELNEILTEDDEARAAKAYEIQKAANDRRLTALQDFAAQAIERGDLTAYLDYSQQAADLAVDIETNALREKMRLRQKDVEDAKAKAAEQRQIMEMSVGATSDIFSALAAIYEADGEANAKSAKRAKALQIASTTIDTISGAVAAYMNAVKAIKDPILGPIIGAAQAAAVSAAGYANIRKIQATDVSGKSTGSTASAPAFVTAPTVNVGTPTTTTTNSTGEDTVNSTPGDSQPLQVYILESQIQASTNAARTKVQESSF